MMGQNQFGCIKHYSAIKKIEFEFEFEYFRIEHDNSGKKSPDWLVEKVELENLETHKVYVFPCGQWLSTEEGDGTLFRQLYPLGKKVTFKDQSKKGKKGME